MEKSRLFLLASPQSGTVICGRSEFSTGWVELLGQMKHTPTLVETEYCFKPRKPKRHRILSFCRVSLTRMYKIIGTQQAMLTRQ